MKDQDQEPSMSYNYFHDVSDPFHGPFYPSRPSSFIPPCLKSSHKQDQDTTYIDELIENKNNLNIVVPSKNDTSIKVNKISIVTSNDEPIQNQEKNSTLMLSKDLFQDQSLPSSCSTIHVCFYFLLFLSLLKLQVILSKKVLLFKMCVILLKILMPTLKMLMSLTII